MSVLIKGMDMPQNCSACKLRMAVGCCGGLPHNTRMPNCPLVPVPPHGRLIDADALNLDYEVEMADDWKTAHEIANVVKYAPTIIDAEE